MMFFTDHMKYYFRIVWRTIGVFAVSCFFCFVFCFLTSYELLNLFFIFIFFTSHREMKIKPLKYWEIRKTFQSFFSSIGSKKLLASLSHSWHVHKWLKSDTKNRLRENSYPYVTRKLISLLHISMGMSSMQPEERIGF